MSKLNIFVDGSWLFKACAPESALAYRLEYPERSFQLDFKKLINSLLSHAKNQVNHCDSIGDCYFSTSIFELPDDLDEWPNERDNVSGADIDSVRRSTKARDLFTNNATSAGFSDQAVFRPRLKGWMIEKLRDHRFQEKQVDATVVALLVKYAITSPNNIHAIITGDADILPAIRVAYPEYSKNVFVATTHPDQLKLESRQSSFALADFNYEIDSYYLEQHAEDIMLGNNIYTCSHCSKVFSRPKVIPRGANPCCHPCHQKRT